MKRFEMIMIDNNDASIRISDKHKRYTIESGYAACLQREGLNNWTKWYEKDNLEFK